MDRKKTKKIRSARIVATNIFMSISVVAIVAVLMLIAMGFSFDESGDIQQSGLLQISSQPTRATVDIDQETLLSTTEINKMVASGSHDIKVSKSGYDTWQKHVDLQAGLLTRIEWVRLFPVEQQIENVATFKTLRLASYSPDNKYFLLAETSDTNLSLISLQGEEIKRDKLPLTQVLSTDDATAIRQGTFSVTSWNDSNNKIILRWNHDNQSSWHLVNLNNPSKSIDLSAKFDLKFDKITTSNDSASELWALENGNLHLIDVSNLQISDNIISNIERFANNLDTIAYVSKTVVSAPTEEDPEAPVETIRALYTYKDGEDGSVKLFDLKDDDQIIFTMGTYWGDEWLAYALNQNLYLLAGKYPNYGKTDSASSLKQLISHENLSYVPNSVRVNASQRIVAFWADKDLATFDIETRDYFDLKLSENSSVNWLDNYLLWESTDKKLVVRDFDGNNRREVLSTTSPASHASITSNNQWLYYLEKATPNADPDTTETIPRFTLKRLKLIL